MGAFYLGLVIRFRDEYLNATSPRLSLGLGYHAMFFV